MMSSIPWFYPMPLYHVEHHWFELARGHKKTAIKRHQTRVARRRRQSACAGERRAHLVGRGREVGWRASSPLPHARRACELRRFLEGSERAGEGGGEAAHEVFVGHHKLRAGRIVLPDEHRGAPSVRPRQPRPASLARGTVMSPLETTEAATDRGDMHAVDSGGSAAASTAAAAATNEQDDGYSSESSSSSDEGNDHGVNGGSLSAYGAPYQPLDGHTLVGDEENDSEDDGNGDTNGYAAAYVPLELSGDSLDDDDAVRSGDAFEFPEETEATHVGDVEARSLAQTGELLRPPAPQRDIEVVDTGSVMRLMAGIDIGAPPAWVAGASGARELAENLRRERDKEAGQAQG